MQIKAAQEVRDCQTLFRSRILHRDVLYFRTDCTEKKLLELYMQEERKGKAHAFKRKEGKDKTP